MINGDNYDNDIHIFATGIVVNIYRYRRYRSRSGRVICNIINHSDNRIKHNEVTISDALITLGN